MKAAGFRPGSAIECLKLSICRATGFIPTLSSRRLRGGAVESNRMF